VVNHPTTRPYLAYALWSYFIATPPTASAMRQMVNNYRKSGFELAAAAEVDPAPPGLLPEPGRAGHGEAPIVFVASGLRNTRRFIKSNSWSWLLDNMGRCRSTRPTCRAGSRARPS
jgi:uncharacterized protein (DUF1800 family)